MEEVLDTVEVRRPLREPAEPSALQFRANWRSSSLREGASCSAQHLGVGLGANADGPVFDRSAV